MNQVFTKLRDFLEFKGSDEDGYLYDEEYYPEEDDDQYLQQEESAQTAQEERQNRWRTREERSTGTAEAKRGSVGTSTGNVIGMPGMNNGLFEVVVIEPHSFETMPEVIQTLRERKSVVLNLTMMEPEEAQRAVDFVAGGTYALEGHQERVGESIFLFAPNSVKVTSKSGAEQEQEEVGHPSGESSSPAPPTPAWAEQPNQIAQ
ncbi:MAG: cell division protein SepF [Cyanobacteria bacterium QH_8_48_120]|nr:MAG: cell division protein SepF [Cyanobacteria bacterium QH_10_48_56]PSO54701.1 MAG: cell division protein SepF [Cyanobacteria bacterium QH_1_48_107]PSO64133.1 MAG: cell division protein SepF [Cyanobacteria bacterium QH_7_48_89]PSO65365.1 MAG: cell division protein SepF [Cyanobacteria bacterium QH_6_48_35]PSO67070.1 MAG: cell division protein SepF [Cyanobacteria bacterium QS_1_48_34]PSO71213.1 MAG: cell division protein SepF [Cyanobacteria bacterium QH_8_48_120]PSO72573.1 MAG: cell divisio